ncbi:HEAT repeat domain-containing protein [Nitrospira moscoviensis]|uniref:HEAT repeat domain-containing protein n=1 Tax=Nitrospira moscoviensis TaxID=42253 RepID=A0A0K2G6S4_NITMO|nr:HEAT repeat domain-containing protein [Nitrospira moscoviensis]ALA56630.1 conserved exported protein of unknown function [Nitrospira moscoviensis]
MSPALFGCLLACSCLLLAGCYRESAPSPDTAVQVLMELIRDRDASVRRTAAEALGKIGDPAAEPALVQALHDPEPAVREAAARSVARLPSFGEATTHQLISLLKDPEPPVRRAAAMGLSGAEENSRHVRAIGEVLTSPDPDFRRSASHALLYLEDPRGLATGALSQGAKDPDPAVRQWALAALAEIGGQSAVPVLMDRLLHDAVEAVRVEAAYRLGFVGDESVVDELKRVVEKETSATLTGWVGKTAASLTKASGFDSGLPPDPPAEPGPSHRSP